MSFRRISLMFKFMNIIAWGPQVILITHFPFIIMIFFSDISVILSSGCGLALTICVVMRSITERARIRKEDGEETSLLQDSKTNYSTSSTSRQDPSH